MNWVILAALMSQDLGAAISAAAQNSVKYVGYEVAMQPGQGTICGWQNFRQDRLMLDGPRRLRILFQVDHGKLGKMKLASEDCAIEPGAQQLQMLPQVSSADSIRFLSARNDDQSIFAISLHNDPKATEALISMARDAKDSRRQKKAFFWLARSKDPSAERFIEKLLR